MGSKLNWSLKKSLNLYSKARLKQNLENLNNFGIDTFKQSGHEQQKYTQDYL